MKNYLTILGAGLVIILNSGSEGVSETRSKYRGQENREIKSLSASDINEINTGGGWGLAKPAEFNGFPGPSHILSMKHRLNLTDQQASKISQLFREMKKQAVEKGEIYLNAERKLDQHFGNKNIDEIKLQNLLKISSRALKDLRYVHLVAHLQSARILSKQQIKNYTLLRGYGGKEQSNSNSNAQNAVTSHKHEDVSKH